MAALAIFGGTGKIGALVLERALAAGHDVQALARDPARLPHGKARMAAVVGDVLDPDAVDRTVTGAAGVLALFGHVKGSAPMLQTDGTRTIVEAMKRHGVHRIVSLSGGALGDASADQPKLADKLIVGAMKLLARQVLADAQGHLNVLKASGLEWTVVRAPRVQDTPALGTYRVGHVGVGTSTSISRADLADFILSQVDDRRYIHQMPFVSR
jgi:putative NADH-flavin reductase